jgi:mannan endo-1,4-beta-mannosidase
VRGLIADTTYTFAVYARDAAGNRSARSASVDVTTDKGTPVPGASCAVGYRVVGDWPGGFQGEIVVRNTGTTPVNGWTLGFSFAAGQTVAQAWGGTAAQTGSTVAVTPASYTATIAPSGSVTVGFIGTKGATNPSPAAFTLNGAACTTA